MKDYYGVGILWNGHQALSPGEKRSLEEGINRAFNFGILDCCKDNPYYTALFEKAGIIEILPGTPTVLHPAFLELFEADHGQSEGAFKRTVRQIVKDWLYEPDDNLEQSPPEPEDFLPDDQIQISLSPSFKKMLADDEAITRILNADPQQRPEPDPDGTRMRLDDRAA